LVLESRLELKESNKIQNLYENDLKQQNEHLLDLVGATYVRTNKKQMHMSSIPTPLQRKSGKKWKG